MKTIRPLIVALSVSLSACSNSSTPEPLNLGDGNQIAELGQPINFDCGGECRGQIVFSDLSIGHSCPEGTMIKDLTRPTYSSGSKFLTIDGDATIEFGPGIYGFDLSSWMNVQPKNSEALSFSDLHSCAGKNDPEWGGVTKVGDDHVRRVSTYEIPADSVEIFLKDPYTGNQIAWKLQ